MKKCKPDIDLINDYIELMHEQIAFAQEIAGIISEDDEMEDRFLSRLNEVCRDNKILLRLCENMKEGILSGNYHPQQYEEDILRLKALDAIYLPKSDEVYADIFGIS